MSQDTCWKIQYICLINHTNCFSIISKHILFLFGSSNATVIVYVFMLLNIFLHTRQNKRGIIIIHYLFIWYATYKNVKKSNKKKMSEKMHNVKNYFKFWRQNCLKRKCKKSSEIYINNWLSADFWHVLHRKRVTRPWNYLR